MYPRVLAILLAAAAIAPASAQTVTIVSRPPTTLPPGSNTVGAWASSLGINPFYVSWTQAAGTQFSAVTASALLCSTNGSPATGLAYLTNQVGAGATSANQIGSVASISTSTPCPVDTASVAAATLTTLNFGSINLPAASTTTYYLVVDGTSANLGWVFEETAAPTPVCFGGNCAGGVVTTINPPNNSNPDTTSTLGPAAYPPASNFNLTLSPNNGALFKVTGNVGIPTSSVPTLSTWAFSGSIILLIGSGLFLMRRFRTQG